MNRDPSVVAALAGFRSHGLDGVSDAVDDELIKLLWKVSHVTDPDRIAAGYPRLSIVKGSASDTEFSITTQVKRICKTALDLNWAIPAWYVDYESASAYSTRPRPEFVRMMADLESGAIDAVAAYYIDRAFRMGSDLEPVLNLVDSRGVKVATSIGELNLLDPGGRMLARVLVTMASYESDTISRRQKSHAVELARRGAWPGGRRPFGFDPLSSDDALPTLRQVPAEAAIIRELYDMVLRDGVTMSATMRWLEGERQSGREGADTINGGPWRRATIRQMLCNSYLAGLREHQPTRVERVPGDDTRRRRVPAGPMTRYKALWDGIVSVGELEAMRALLYDEKRLSTPTGAKSRKHALTGYLVCECGTKMYSSYGTGRNGRKIPRYSCVSANGGCGRTSRAIVKLDRVMRDLVIVALADQQVHDAAEGAVLVEDRTLGDIQADLERIEGRRQAFAKKFASGAVDEDMFDAFNAETKANADLLRHELSERLEEAVDETRIVVGNGDAIARLWDEGTQAERHELIRAAGVMLRISVVGRGTYPDMAGIEVLDAAEFARATDRRNHR